MLQKHFKYLLLAGVALIWGIVLYKILNNIDSNPAPTQAILQKSILKETDSSIYQPYTLLINYTDPFGADEDIPNTESSSDPLTKEIVTYSANSRSNNIKPDISFIKYKGIISNSITHKKAAIISVNGEDELARVNRIVDNIKINAIKKDKIQVTYQQNKHWIKRQ